ncbi:hypothetical protein FGB62_12g235 [Gracilaria domingensis]|nr:hypothetical protein FGB62_12g235 [Gracilaria domingensis]
MPKPCPERLRSGKNTVRTQTSGKKHIPSIVTSSAGRSKEMQESHNLEGIERLQNTEIQTRSATLPRLVKARNLDRSNVNFLETQLRTGVAKDSYTKTDQYTATNNVVAGTEVNDLTIRLYMASIRSSSGACSGTVIGRRWILTAAHCQVREGGEALVGGNTNLNGASYRVNRFIAHPEYRLSQEGQVEANDIAVIETDLMKHGSAVLLNMNGKGPDAGRFVRASGYGQIAEEWTSSSERMLLQVDIPIVSFKRCIQAFVSYGAPEFARALQSRSHMCVGYADDDCAGDTCYGDSGGPIVARAEGKYVQVGVVSGGIGCARKGLPGFYTRVGRYWEWIQNVTNGEVEGFSVRGDDGADEVDVSELVDDDTSDGGVSALKTLGIIAGAVGLGVILFVMAGLLIKRIRGMVVEPTPEKNTNEAREQNASMDKLLQFQRGPQNGKGLAMELTDEGDGGAAADGEAEEDESEFQMPTYSRTRS